MINDQLLSYVKQQLSLGIGRETVTTNLKSQGWTDADVQEAFLAVSSSTATSPTSVPISPISPVSSAVFGLTPNVVPMQSTPLTTQTDFSSPVLTHNKSKKLLLIISILILLGLAGGGAAYAYYTGMFVKLPDLMSGYASRAQDLKSFKLDIDINADLSEVKSISDQLKSLPVPVDVTKFNFNLFASYDISDRNDMKISSNFSVAVGPIFFEAQMRILDGILYSQLTKMPELSVLPVIIPKEYENKWFSFPYDSLPNKGLLNEFTVEETAYLEKMFNDARIIKTIKKLATETISGEPSYHFSFDWDKEAFLVYMQLYKDYLISIGKSDAQLSAFDITYFRKLLDQVKDFKGEIWVGRNDKLVHKLYIGFGIQPDITKDEQVKVSLTVIASDYNQPVSVVAPAESTPFQTLIDASLGEARQKGAEAAIKANLSNLRAQAEIFYDSHKFSYSGFCASSELKITRKAIEDIGGTGFICKDKATAYALGANFSQKDSKGWCVDSTGVSKSTATLPSSTVCP